MTKIDKNWKAKEEAKRAFLSNQGMYAEEEEHSSCGVGLVVSIEGKKSRKVVDNGIAALRAVWHRGAVDADGKTGDGAGIHLQIPIDFFYDQVERTGHNPRKDQLLAVGQIFLPRTDFGAQETCRTIVESEVLKMGYYIYGWRHVPVDISCLGEKANTAEEEGVEFVWLSAPKGFVGEGEVNGVIVSKMRLGAPDSSGRQSPEEIVGAEYTEDADLVIKALGFNPEDLPTLWDTPELEITRWGTIKTDFHTHATSLDGVYAAGDIVRGASLVVWAIRDGREAADSILAFLNSQTLVAAE